ncbi:Membrane dipeptidase (Peptidase family M19) [Symmachiella dynata]|uniref:dipeptidase n=1 Tax=Symmachiella dynata TaxID=2527995 RepID=UPI00118B4846|nr:membrane dipeptidase [Symmachiella dynata]QDT46662.1 Membrane dipeptidase (Peptidase family M19) [Symmachiella dynata]
MLIFDAHLDMAWNALEFNRDLMLPVSEIRKFERQFTDIVPGENTVSWTELRKGNVFLTISTLIARLHRKDAVRTFYQSREADYGAARGQMAYYQAMVERGVLRPITDVATLDAHVAEWESGNTDELPMGYILSMEGSQPVQNPEQIHHWYDLGLRILGPAHYGENPYCFGTGSQGGLKADGPALLKAMDAVGMLLDATHLADQSFWEALDIFEGPVLASHHNCRALVDADRQLTDDQIKALIERGSVIGAAMDAWMIQPGWVIGVTQPSDACTLSTLADHIDHICQIAGNANHCGIGSDLDGGFGKEQSPHDLETIADLYKLGEILKSRGYSDADVEGIMYRNWVDFFRRAWA